MHHGILVRNCRVSTSYSEGLDKAFWIEDFYVLTFSLKVYFMAISQGTIKGT